MTHTKVTRTGTCFSLDFRPPEDWNLPRELFRAHVPSIDMDRLGVARLPCPPKIPDGSIQNSHVVHCSFWLKAWVHTQYGHKPRYSKRTRYDARKNHKAIFEGVKALRTAGCSAARWVSWFDRLLQARGQIQPPAVATVFSRGIVLAHVGEVVQSYPELGGRLVRVPSYLQLAKVHADMMSALMARRPQDSAGIKSVVAQFFPGESFQRLEAQVAYESAKERSRLENCLGKVEWIW